MFTALSGSSGVFEVKVSFSADASSPYAIASVNMNTPSQSSVSVYSSSAIVETYSILTIDPNWTPSTKMGIFLDKNGEGNLCNAYFFSYTEIPTGMQLLVPDFAGDFIPEISISSVSGSYNYQVYANEDSLAVPEPSTYAAILGLLSIGFVFLRKRK